MRDDRGSVIDRLYSLKNSFKYASSGIYFCFKYERNMRIHFVITLYVLFFSRFYNFEKSEIVTIILLCALVMSLEMINTAIEVVVDKISPAYSTLAKISKDVAAGAVFTSSIAAAAVGFIMFFQVDVIEKIFLYFTEQLTSICLLLASAVLSMIFVNSGKTRRNSEKFKIKSASRGRDS